ncbi:unnamed protein product [Ceutorhynchus assimilis]|uniref:Uncharacterized protein n=1 Tax=Ceutorhynchus assimilis TaxID=467358 RepID=A0A9N9MJ77_9CUCU|nr:unnamed protein product [Ceutorhynchus assimilis]
MQHLLLLNALLFTFISISFTYPCSSSIGSDCCSKSCCRRRDNDCNSRCLNDERNCVDCSRRDNSCCGNKECNSRCPRVCEDCSRRDDLCCVNENCDPKCPDNCEDDNPSPNYSTTPSPNYPTIPNPPTTPSAPYPYPPTTPFAPYPSYPPWPIIPQSNTSHYSNNTSINRNNNTITIPTNINIQNEVKSDTRITIPVSIKVDTFNTINIKQEEFTRTSNTTSNNKCDNNTIIINENTNCTEQEAVTVPVPIYRPIPVPYIITVPRPLPVPQGCCQVVSPCSPYNYGGCQRSSTQCSQDCSESHVYQPSDVCGTGCYRRSTAMGGYCGYGGCYRRQVDCGTCDRRFFEDYESFVRCSGCFVPRPWGTGQ